MRSVLVLLTVVMVAGCSGAVATEQPTLGADGCPTAWPARHEWDDRPGPLVPAEGAVSVTLCELLTPLPTQGGPRPAPAPGEARKLTTHVAEMVAAINALPSDERSSAGAMRICTAVGYGEELSFSVAYREGPPAVVLLDRNCGTARHDGRTRLLRGKPIDTFKAFHRRQQAVGAASVPTPSCPAGFAAVRLDIDRPRDFPRDDVARDRGQEGPLLPSPLAAVTACRYRAEKDRFVLARERSVRADLEWDRSLLNAATDAETVKDEGGGLLDVNHSPCVRDGLPSRVDVVWAADVTGAVAETRVWRGRCEAVFAGTVLGVVAERALLSRLDAWLGG